MPLVHASSYPLWVNLTIFFIAAVFVWLAGTRLSRYLGRISEITGIEQAIVGMLMLGVLTSLPEIANVATSSHFGNPALAANNLLGSAAINLVLLAIADAIFGRDALTSIVAQPAILLQSTLCMLVLAVVAAAIVTGDVLIFGVGAWSTAVFLLSLGAFWMSTGYGRRSQWTLHNHKKPAASSSSSSSSKKENNKKELSRLLLRIAIAAAVILVAGYSLSQTGDALAEQTGLGSGLVGFLLIGFATSLPELSSITTSIRMRRHEMAIGEVLGTNFVNVSLLLLADAVYTEGPVINELGRFETISALLGAILTGTLLVGLLERRNPVVLRIGYDTLAILLLFAGGVGLLFTLR